jgi:hypothetical protein
MSKPDKFLIPEFEAANDTPLSRRRMNGIVRAINALLNATIARGESDTVVVSDRNVIFQLEDPVTTSADNPTQAGNLTYRGLYSAAVDYAVHDLVYTSDGTTRTPWVALVPNGPQTAVAAPTWPEPTAVKWRCLAKQNAGIPQCHRLKSVQADHLVCRTFDPVSGAEGATDVYVAKSPKLRETLVTESPADGITWNYSYFYGITNNRVRLKAEGTALEYQQVYPMWCVNDEIWAVQTDGTGISLSTGFPPVETLVTLLQLGDGRAWGRMYDPPA